LVARFNGSTWTPFLNIGGIAANNLSCTTAGITGQVLCSVRGQNSGQFVNRFNGGAWALAGWTGWGSLGGNIGSDASCASQGVGLYTCGIYGATDGALWVNVFNSTSWSGWLKIGQTAIGRPSCSALSLGKAICTVVNFNNKSFSVVGP
jgi:hypothetical protein